MGDKLRDGGALALIRLELLGGPYRRRLGYVAQVQ